MQALFTSEGQLLLARQQHQKQMLCRPGAGLPPFTCVEASRLTAEVTDFLFLCKYSEFGWGQRALSPCMDPIRAGPVWMQQSAGWSFSMQRLLLLNVSWQECL